MQVFLDCDGVLADFDGYAIELLGIHPREYERRAHSDSALWKELYAHPDFFYRLPLMQDARDLVGGVLEMGYDPIILTGVPSHEGSDWAIAQKVRWAGKYFPSIPIICCKSAEKFKHMIPMKHNVLIDDWPKFKPVWEEAGGTFILHKNAVQSLEELKNVG